MGCWPLLVCKETSSMTKHQTYGFMRHFVGNFGHVWTNRVVLTHFRTFQYSDGCSLINMNKDVKTQEVGCHNGCRQKTHAIDHHRVSLPHQAGANTSAGVRVVVLAGWLNWWQVVWLKWCDHRFLGIKMIDEPFSWSTNQYKSLQ